MTETTLAYNPFEQSFIEDPYSKYREFRAHDPVHLSPFGVWVLFSHADIVAFLRDPTLSVEESNAAPGPLVDLAREAMKDAPSAATHAMLNRDPPAHTRLRRLVGKAFTARAVEALRPRVEQLAGAAFDRISDRGEVDLMDEVCLPLPFQVISDMLGMPESESAQLRAWSDLLVVALEPVADSDTLRRIGDARAQMRDSVLEVVASKRRNPCDDLTTALALAEEDGDRLADDELADQIIMLYVAGHRTAVNLLVNGAHALLSHSDQAATLRADPALDVNAVEELLRFDSPVQASRRFTLRSIEVRDKTIEAGSLVALMLGSANRDEARWGDDSEQLKLERPGANQHIAFGGGMHYCLGAALARLEGQVILGSLLRRFPRLTITGEPRWNGLINLRGISALPVSPSGR